MSPTFWQTELQGTSWTLDNPQTVRCYVYRIRMHHKITDNLILSNHCPLLPFYFSIYKWQILTSASHKYPKYCMIIIMLLVKNATYKKDKLISKQDLSLQTIKHVENTDLYIGKPHHYLALSIRKQHRPLHQIQQVTLSMKCLHRKLILKRHSKNFLKAFIHIFKKILRIRIPLIYCRNRILIIFFFTQIEYIFPPLIHWKTP